LVHLRHSFAARAALAIVYGRLGTSSAANLPHDLPDVWSVRQFD